MLSGLSSVVRKCVHKASGQEYAVKIVDKLGDHGGCDIGEVTKNEAEILKILSGHKNISKLRLVLMHHIIWTRSLRLLVRYSSCHLNLKSVYYLAIL